MPINQTPPSAVDVNESVERVRGELFSRLRRPAKQRPRRTVIAVIAAVALFVGGIGIGAAAAYASTGSAPTTSGPAVAPTSGPSEFSFRVDCYTGPDAANPSTSDPWIQLGYNKVTDPTGDLLAAAAANPAQACQSKSEDIARTKAYLTSAQSEPTSATRLTVTMPGIAPFYLWSTWSDPNNSRNPPTAAWENRPRGNTQDSHLTTGSYLKPAGYPSGCAEVAIPQLAVPHPRLAACVVDATHSAVFIVKPTGTPTDTCRSHDYQSWTS